MSDASQNFAARRPIGVDLLQQIGAIARKWGEVMGVAYEAEWGKPPRRVDHEPMWAQRAFDAAWGKIQEEIGVGRIFEGSQSTGYWTLYRTASREFDQAFMQGPRACEKRRNPAIKKSENTSCNAAIPNANDT